MRRLLEGLVLFALVRIGNTPLSGASNSRGVLRGYSHYGMGCRASSPNFSANPMLILGYIAGFITMGMILSLPLCAIGVWLL